MKNNKPLIIIGIVLLNLLVVYVIGQTLLGKPSEYDSKLKEAREYVEKELYNKAIKSYDEVILLKDSAEVRLEQLDAYEKALESGEITNSYSIITFLTNSVDAYKRAPEMYERACGILYNYGKYAECSDLLVQARDFGVESEKLDEIIKNVRYKYQTNYSMYSDVYPMFDDTFLAKSEDRYTYLDSDGFEISSRSYDYATAFSNGYAFVQEKSGEDSVRSILIDKGEVRQAYFDGVETSSGVGEAVDKDGNTVLLLACKVGDVYKYFNIDGTEAFGEYVYAGRFRNGVAPVKEDGETWRLINGSGEYASDKKFSDVILSEFEDCAAKGYIFAKDGEKYHMYYCRTMEQIGDFACDEAKCFAGDLAAFRSGETWGYVDMKGNVVIEPRFEDARSFSNGIAAVRVGDAWNFINAEGEIIIEEPFEEVGYLSDSGICFVKRLGYWSFIKFYYNDK